MPRCKTDTERRYRQIVSTLKKAYKADVTLAQARKLTAEQCQCCTNTVNNALKYFNIKY